MSDKNDSDLIRADRVEAFNLWDLPSFDLDGHHVPREDEPEAEPEPEVEAPAVEEIPEEPEVKPFTVEELEQIRAEAYNEGFATGERDGFHSGQLKAQQEARERLEARVAELEALMSHLMEPIRDQDEQIEDMLLELVETMVRQVVQRELHSDSSQIRQVLRGALKALPVGAEQIRIYLNPTDFETVRAIRERHEESWRLLEDDQLLPGGCRVEAEHSQVDASRETRLQQVIQQLHDQRREQRANPPAADGSDRGRR
ncbi:flagellar assembly protein FliH [Halopseudomonas formosensis]|uniref:Flagellar assembly protein FliH n=1 Tax=Halopseudomonas formosensis TaxID=1002526 RepID=A0ABU5BWY6_9GAMM|nr:flagellar assembly protein FliH [Halopseudomonas formosensis]MDX9687279.1 flagellar assembly protein FliH [Halopseudomonas formosensis]